MLFFLCILQYFIGSPLPVGATKKTTDDGNQVEKLKKSLTSDPSFRVRSQAAASLGALGDHDAVPALVQSLIEDPNELVRGACAEALGEIADEDARPALRAAKQDPNPAVRVKAEAALAHMDRKPEARPEPRTIVAPEKRIPVTLGRMGSRARGLVPDLPKRLREAIARELRSTPDVVVLTESDRSSAGFTVESSVTELSRRTTSTGALEVTCEVSMVIGVLPSHTIVGMTSGGATIQSPVRRFRPDRAVAQELEADALAHAVRGAHQNLLAFLRNQK